MTTSKVELLIVYMLSFPLFHSVPVSLPLPAIKEEEEAPIKVASMRLSARDRYTLHDILGKC